jgi:RecA/RadA recombinase
MLGIGGLPRGRIVEVLGPESSGVSTLLLHAVAAAQGHGGLAALVDANMGFDPEYARRIGVDVDDTYRRQNSAQHNIQEGRHQLARKIFHGQRGELRQR